METAEPQARTIIRNRDELTSHGLTGLREDALRIAQVGLRACDGGRITREIVRPVDGGISIDGVTFPLSPGARLIVLGAGKATLPIASALEETLGDRIDGGAVVLRRGETATLERIKVLIADHPLPTEASVEAATRLVEIASGIGRDDLVISCFTGGSSALVSLPPEGIPFKDKRLLHRMLLGSGMPITEVNAVRKHVSDVKGGRLASLIAPARIVNLTVSDVAGDRLDAITDLTVPDDSTVAEAISVLHDYHLWDTLPVSIIRHLESPAAASPELPAARINTVLLATGAAACEAMVEEANARGFSPVILTTTMEVEARQMGRFVADLALSSQRHGYPFEPGTALLGCGSENSVTLGARGSFGDGGPSQEAALSAAIDLDGSEIAAIFMDTDGADGGTESAGAIADGETAARAVKLGLNLRRSLLQHSSREPLAELGDLIRTGATGTNVNDLFVVVVA